MDKSTIMFMIIICAFTITIGMLIGIGISVDHTHKIGQMVCDEYGFGEYQGFDSDNKIIKCNEKYVKKTFGGGKVRIVKGDEK